MSEPSPDPSPADDVAAESPDAAPSSAQAAPAEGAPVEGAAAEVDAAPAEGAATDAAAAGVAAEPSRRQLLAWGALGAGACVGAGALGVVGTALIGTPLQGAAPEAVWCPLGPLKGLSEGPRKLPLRAPGRDAWRRLSDRALGRVIVIREGETVQAFSAACPHNGCDVAVGEGGVELLCPCHASRFALDGERIEGQSPRGLDPLETRVREGQVEVRFQRFALGTESREAL